MTQEELKKLIRSECEMVTDYEANKMMKHINQRIKEVIGENDSYRKRENMSDKEWRALRAKQSRNVLRSQQRKRAAS